MRALVIFAVTGMAMAWYPQDSSAQAQTRISSRRRARKPRARKLPAAPTSAAITTSTGLTYLITQHGSGQPVKAGEKVTVHYTGMLTNGVKFDSSRDHNQPFEFSLGAGNVIKGWDEGVSYLHVGDQAILVIPPQLGYGAKSVGDGLIPPNSTLIFIIEVVASRAP